MTDLNRAQLEAVGHGDGPLLVIAGAGTGKTKMLVHRTAELTETVDADKILLVTFTKKAAQEMGERLGSLVDRSTAAAVTSGTFHSVCFRLLREEDATLEVVPEWKMRSTIKGLIGGPSKMWPQAVDWPDADLSSVLHLLSLARNERLTPDELELMWRKGPSIDTPMQFRGPALRKLPQVWRLYDEWKRERGVVDFDDMLILVLDRLESDDVYRKRIQHRWTHVLVDETQDTNRVQWELLKIIAAPQNNITAVGDVRQSIYGWRGAKPEQVLAFAEHFPGARILGLTENYRSDEHVIRLANAIAAAMPEDHEPLVATRPAERGPVVRHFDGPEDEARFIANEIAAGIKLGDLPDEFAVLYRTNAQSRAFEDELLRNQVPYIVVGSLGFYGRSEIQDMLAYLRAALDHNDRDAITRVIKRPTRYLGKAYVDAVDTYVNGHPDVTYLQGLTATPRLKDWQIEKARDFVGVVKQIREMTPANAIRFVRGRTEYDHWLASEEGTEDIDSSKIENLNELVVAAERFEKISDLLAFAQRQQDAAKSQDPRGRVVLSTIHRAKGLEWPYVYVAGASEGLLPHQRSIEEGDVTEERRLWYVAATRARDRLTVSYLTSWQSKPLDVSSLVVEVGLVERAAAVTLLEQAVTA